MEVSDPLRSQEGQMGREEEDGEQAKAPATFQWLIELSEGVSWLVEDGDDTG